MFQACFLTGRIPAPWKLIYPRFELLKALGTKDHFETRLERPKRRPLLRQHLN